MKIKITALTLLIAGFVIAAISFQLPVFAAAPSSGMALTGSSYPIVDTAQNKCYNNLVEIPCPSKGVSFYGQDAQVSGNLPSYTLSSSKLTVLDNVTGLTWERSPETNNDGLLNKADKLTYTQALAHCSAHNTASYQGYTDWRLPAIKELYSLVTFNGTDPSGYSGSDTSGLKPFINTSYFKFAYGQTKAGERIIDSQYASSSLYAQNTGIKKLFGVNFADGRIKGYDLSMSGGVAKTFFVQCVRGNSAYGLNQFVDNGNQTITDEATGLMWTKSDSNAGMNWQAALAWVQAKNAQNYLGFTDWRLPNAKEMQSIVDYSRSPSISNSAAINPIFSVGSFKNETGQKDYPWYWTSTTHASYNSKGAAGIYLAFGRATGWQKSTAAATCYSLVDVHGAGAQRSDPKTTAGLQVIGNACGGGTAYGMGPQGDTQRVNNYVRLVRNNTQSVVKTSTPTRTAVAATSTATVTSTPTQLPSSTPTATLEPSSTPTTTATLTSVPAATEKPTAGPGSFNINQTLSDGAQRMTIAFDGLSFLTGSLGADSFFPPGKVADFWGFQYLRDNDLTGMGHNTDFLTKVSLNMLNTLTASQQDQLVTLAKSQVDSINEYGYKRFVLMTAFRRLLSGDLPAGTTGLSEDAVKAFSAELYHLDGQISFERAQVMGDILHNLSNEQKAAISSLIALNGVANWPSVSEPDGLRPLSHDEKVAVMTYAGDLMSWYVGSVEADVYFCPERQGTYFGSFYMKDAPAVGNPGYSIGTNITADMGNAFLQTLTTPQSQLITGLVDTQFPSLTSIVTVRQQVAVELRKFMAGQNADSATVLSLMDTYGQLDGAIVYSYATKFVQVGQNLSDAQKAQLTALRIQTLGSFSPTAAFLYATLIDFPTVQNTDFLFK